MSAPRPPSWALVFYYGFLLTLTAASYGAPYPLLGAVLTGTWARAAIVVDCLLLVHIVIGVWKAQRLTWYLLLGYNGFELASLAVTLAALSPARVDRLTGGGVSLHTFAVGAAVAGLGMAAATVYAFRLRRAFSNRSPYLF